MTNKTDYEKVLDKLKSEVDWDMHCVSCFITSQDTDMNRPSLRFGKSTVLSEHLVQLGGGWIKYVDQPGWDFELPEMIEDKTEAFLLKTPVQKSIKKNISVMLKNTMGEKKITSTAFRETIKFGALLLRQTGGDLGEQVVALLDPLKLEDEDIKIGKDQITLKFDSSKLDWIYFPTEEKKVELREVYKQCRPTEPYSLILQNITKRYVENLQNNIHEATLKIKNGESVAENNNSSLQGQQKEAA